MKHIKIPFQVKGGRVGTTDRLKESIDASLTMLMNTPQGDLFSDPKYGFLLSALRFEMMDEVSGTIYNSRKDGNPIYDKTVSGTSTNLQSFASSFNELIARYEPRLKNTTTTMSYLRESRRVLLDVKGLIVSDNSLYEFKTSIKVWS